MINLDDLFDKPGKPDENGGPLPPDSMFRELPALHAYCTFPTAKGDPRALSTISIGCSGNRFFVRLVDTDNNRSLTLACDDVNAGLLLLDGAVQKKNVDWFYWKTNARGSNKKK